MRARTAVQTAPTPGVGDLLLSPVALVCVAGLVINDHWLKGRGAGWLTGMLSDATGAVLVALLLVAVVEVAGRHLGRAEPVGIVGAACMVAVTVCGVALAKCTDLGNAIASRVLGAFRWPIDAAIGLVSGGGVTGPGHVAIVRDPLDVVAALACCVVVWMVARRADGSTGDAPVETAVSLEALERP